MTTVARRAQVHRGRHGIVEKLAVLTIPRRNLDASHIVSVNPAEPAGLGPKVPSFHGPGARISTERPNFTDQPSRYSPLRAISVRGPRRGVRECVPGIPRRADLGPSGAFLRGVSPTRQ